LATLYPALGWLGGTAQHQNLRQIDSLLGRLVAVGGTAQHQDVWQVDSLLGWLAGVGGTAQHQDVRQVDSLLGRPPGEVIGGHRGHSHKTMLAVLAGRGRRDALLANLHTKKH
jgi:hypothetical protein